MTIASAFNDIAVAQGGTASTSGAIDDAARAMASALGETIVVEEATVETIDSLTDKTIEDAVTLLGQHIGGGGGKHPIAFDPDAPEGTLMASLYDPETSSPIGGAITEAAAGAFVAGVANNGAGVSGYNVVAVNTGVQDSTLNLGHSMPGVAFFVMPDRDDVMIALAED